jgi:hypothetical protein
MTLVPPVRIFCSLLLIFVRPLDRLLHFCSVVRCWSWFSRGVLTHSSCHSLSGVRLPRSEIFGFSSASRSALPVFVRLSRFLNTSFWLCALVSDRHDSSFLHAWCRSWVVLAATGPVRSPSLVVAGLELSFSATCISALTRLLPQGFSFLSPHGVSFIGFGNCCMVWFVWFTAVLGLSFECELLQGEDGIVLELLDKKLEFS